MIRKITYLISFVLLLSVILNFTSYSPMNGKYKSAPIVTVNDNAPRNLNSVPYSGNIDPVTIHRQYTTTYSDSILDITDVYMGESTLYDLQSNAVTQQLMQKGMDTLHAVLMQNLTPGIPGGDRTTQYIVSSNGGATWTTLGAVSSGAGVSSGYAAIYLQDDGTAVVGNHSSEGGLGAHPTIYHDIAPLVGVWSLCDPGGTSATTRVWLRFCVTSTNKVPFISAYNAAVDTATWTNVLTVPHADIDNAEQYSMERAANGTIGIAYIRSGFNPADAGDIRYITSTDDGVTWSSPTVIYDAPSSPTEFLGGLRDVDLVYTGNTPNVVYGLIWQTDAGSYYPGFMGRIMFWNPTVNSGNPVLLCDSTMVPYHPLRGANTINDVYPSITRATIGKSSNESILYCTFSVAREEVSPNPDSTPYMDTYFTWSNDHGATWNGYKSLTNLSGPIRDNRYPCLAPISYNDNNFYYANLVNMNDSIPGSSVNGAAETLSQFHFIQVKLPSLIGVRNIGSTVPKNFALNQNYPNPFNPTTKISFELPTSQFVTMKVYDVVGREVAVLVNEKLTAGKKEYEFNASNLPSGVYFYTINAGDFKATRKMVLVK